MDPVVHAAECVRFDGYVVNGPHDADSAIWAGAIGADGDGWNRAELHLLRAALAITLASNVIAASARRRAGGRPSVPAALEGPDTNNPPAPPVQWGHRWAGL